MMKLTGSFSSILNVILLTVSPTLLNSLRTPALLKADVFVALGSSTSASRNSLKSGSVLRKGWAAVLT